MPEYTSSIFLQCLAEWGALAGKFRRRSTAEQAAFLQDQGYASLHDLLAHVAVWWEEAEAIIRDQIEGRARPARKYDFDGFNAAALARFKETSETELLNWYESQRQRMTVLVSALTAEQIKMPRVASWLDGVILEHLKEHGLDAPRFLTLDTLQREWRGYTDRFNGLTDEKQRIFLGKQGFRRFRDVVAHIIAWWQQGLPVIESGADTDPCEVEDVDAFNAEAVERFGRLTEAEVFAECERTRWILIKLVDTLPDDVISKPNVQSWLRSDVIDHYFDHKV